MTCPSELMALFPKFLKPHAAILHTNYKHEPPWRQQEALCSLVLAFPKSLFLFLTSSGLLLSKTSGYKGENFLWAPVLVCLDHMGGAWLRLKLRYMSTLQQTDSDTSDSADTLKNQPSTLTSSEVWLHTKTFIHIHKPSRFKHS